MPQMILTNELNQLFKPHKLVGHGGLVLIERSEHQGLIRHPVVGEWMVTGFRVKPGMTVARKRN